VNPSSIQSTVELYAGLIVTIAAIVAATLAKLLPYIAQIKADVDNLKTTAQTHTDQIAANTVAIHQTALLTPTASIAPPVAIPPETADAKLEKLAP
jgi:hypothetical protein